MPKLKRDEWMPFTIGHYVRDTMDLTTTEHGAYLLLTMHYWCRGPLPTEPSRLAIITKQTLTAWNRMAGTILAFFKEGDDGRLHHKRLDSERERCADVSDKRSEAGRAGAEAKKAKKAQSSAETDAAIAYGLLNQGLREEEEQEEEER